jgi:hypothetical protein
LSKETYKFYVKWLQEEPNVDLVVPAIKEDIAKKNLTPQETDILRTRVVTIKKYGHEKYLKLTLEEVALKVFDEAKILNDEERERGNCCERIK